MDLSNLYLTTVLITIVVTITANLGAYETDSLRSPKFSHLPLRRFLCHLMISVVAVIPIAAITIIVVALSTLLLLRRRVDAKDILH